MKNIFIAIASGIALYVLYIKTQDKRNAYRDKQGNERGRELLFDSRVDRRCECTNSFCTCGRHVL